MKILVPVKQVVDQHIPLSLSAAGELVFEQVKWVMNPFDEIALEAAVRLKEAGQADEVIAVSCGGASVVEVLRSALALGADRAIQVLSEQVLQPLQVAQLLLPLVQREAVGLVIGGKQSVDGDANQTLQMLAALLDWPQACHIAKVERDGELLTVEREIDGGSETLELDLPAVLTADLRLNEPRFATLPNIMKARKKPLLTVTPAELGVVLASGLSTLSLAEPTPRAAGIKVTNVAELLQQLQQAHVL